jgi:hypothetical protein
MSMHYKKSDFSIFDTTTLTTPNISPCVHTHVPHVFWKTLQHFSYLLNQ